MRKEIIGGLTFRYKENFYDYSWTGICEELDLVTEGKTFLQCQSDLKDIVIAQMVYCIKNDNLDYLFVNKTKKVWDNEL